MKKFSLVLTALLGLGAALPSAALAGRGDHRDDRRGDYRGDRDRGYGRERTRVIHDRCGNPIFQVYTFVGRRSCGEPIFRWISRPAPRHHHHHDDDRGRGFASGGFSIRIGR